jgi:transposase
MVLLTELGDIRRFATPRHLMSYVGLVPSVHQSGETRKSGSITKTGSSRCRHVLVQAAWCNTRSVRKVSAAPPEGVPAWVLESARNAQKRLYSRFRHLEETAGRHKAVVAIARELVGFLGATLHELATEPQSVR